MECRRNPYGQKIKGKRKKPFLLPNLTRDGEDADHKRLQRGSGRG